MTFQTPAPAFITFTGVDTSDLLPGMLALSARYPIEWGILIDPEQDGRPLFPDPRIRGILLAAPLRFSAHLCGSAARAVVEGAEPQLDLQAFSRAQINHTRAGSTDAEILHSALFGARHGLRVALQCQGEFPADGRVDWLYDVSFGTGVRPTTWPAAHARLPFCGYSGGLGPDNVAATLAQLPIAPGAGYWIDMESGVRTANRFDLEKCAAVCAAVFDPACEHAHDAA